MAEQSRSACSGGSTGAALVDRPHTIRAQLSRPLAVPFHHRYSSAFSLPALPQLNPVALPSRGGGDILRSAITRSSCNRGSADAAAGRRCKPHPTSPAAGGAHPQPPTGLQGRWRSRRRRRHRRGAAAGGAGQPGARQASGPHPLPLPLSQSIARFRTQEHLSPDIAHRTSVFCSSSGAFICLLALLCMPLPHTMSSL